jgi:hypothetical protein
MTLDELVWYARRSNEHRRGESQALERAYQRKK